MEGISAARGEGARLNDEIAVVPVQDLLRRDLHAADVKRHRTHENVPVIPAEKCFVAGGDARPHERFRVL